MPTPPTTPRHMRQRNRAPTSTPTTPNQHTNPLSPRMRAVAETIISDVSPLAFVSTPPRSALSSMSPSPSWERDPHPQTNARKPTAAPTSAPQPQPQPQPATDDDSTLSNNSDRVEIKLLTCPTCLKTSLHIVSPTIHPDGTLSHPCHMCSSCFVDFVEKERRFRQKREFVSFPRLMEDRGEGEGETEGNVPEIGKHLSEYRNASWRLGGRVMGLFMGGHRSSRDQSEASSRTEGSCSDRGSEFSGEADEGLRMLEFLEEELSLAE